MRLLPRPRIRRRRLAGGPRIAFATFQFLARHATWSLKERANENSFIKAARRGEKKHDDLPEPVTVTRLSGHRRRRPRHRPRGAARHWDRSTDPKRLGRWPSDSPLTRDADTAEMGHVLGKAGA